MLNEIFPPSCLLSETGESTLYYTLFYKVSGLIPGSCLYSQGFRGSKLINGCSVVEEYNNIQDSKSMLMISDSKIFPIMLLRQLICIVGLTPILHLSERKNSSLISSFLLLLSERGLSPESCLAICHARASCL